LISLIKDLSIILMLSSLSTWVNQYFLRVIHHGISIEVKFQGWGWQVQVDSYSRCQLLCSRQLFRPVGPLIVFLNLINGGILWHVVGPLLLIVLLLLTNYLLPPNQKNQKEGFPKSAVGLGEDPHQEA
jgi:hypothetical protein